jgi:hypothetical protein
VAFDFVTNLFTLRAGCYERKDDMWILPPEVYDLALQLVHGVHIEIRRETVMTGRHERQKRQASGSDPARRFQNRHKASIL